MFDEPSTLLRARQRPVTSATCTLVVTEGADVGATFTLDDLARRILIGQSVACDVRLSDPAVSRRHAAIEVDAVGLRVVDLDSSNGTSVNGVRVKEAYLPAIGAVIQLGTTSLRVTLGTDVHVLPASEEVRFHRVLGASPEMRRLYPLFTRLAATDVPVLIEGESGTGKEVLAESLHEVGPRSDGPFVIFDCTTVAPSLVEAELFGHERGAFTGAATARRGLFEEAHNGTLFIDEIGDLEAGLQAKLLRALEKSEVRRVGSNKWVRVNVRILAATRRDLDHEVQAGRFREDLFYRLAVARLELPPLRRRQGDVPLLARYFWAALGGREAELPPEIIDRLEEHSWPGNVRELYNAIARQLALGDAAHLAPARVAREEPSGAAREDFLDLVVREGKPLPRARQEVVQEFERRYLQRMLALHGGSVQRAASASGIGRRYFQMIRARN